MTAMIDRLKKDPTTYGILAALLLGGLLTGLLVLLTGGGGGGSSSSSAVTSNEMCRQDVTYTFASLGQWGDGAVDYPGGGNQNPVFQLMEKMMNDGVQFSDSAAVERECADAGNPNNSAYGWDYR